MSSVCKERSKSIKSGSCPRDLIETRLCWRSAKFRGCFDESIEARMMKGALFYFYLPLSNDIEVPFQTNPSQWISIVSKTRSAT